MGELGTHCSQGATTTTTTTTTTGGLGAISLARLLRSLFLFPGGRGRGDAGDIEGGRVKQAPPSG